MPKQLLQYAALPWRNLGHGIEVLLITSRETRRWVIPKGWPIGGMRPKESAAREAYEEAGIGGMMPDKIIGTYDYDKRLGDGSVRPVRVVVFPMEAMIQHPDWPEQQERSARWFKRDDAAKAVAEPGLAKLIRKLK